MVIFYILAVVLQKYVKRSQPYIDFINNVIQIRRGLKKVELNFEEVIAPEEKCLFSFHPHGVLSASGLTFMNYSSGPMSKMVVLSSRAMLNLPIVGLLLRLWGVEAVDHKNLKRLMKRGENVSLYPGGFE